MITNYCIFNLFSFLVMILNLILNVVCQQTIADVKQTIFFMKMLVKL